MLRAIMFDCNGVIADDERPHFLCFRQALAEHGLSLTQGKYYGTYPGMDERACAEALIRRSRGRIDPALADAIHARKAALFFESTAAAQPPLFEGVVNFVKEAGMRYRLAIASGGRREQIARALRGTPIEQAFSVTVSSEDASIGKPDPFIYQQALHRLNETEPGLRPALVALECLVIEDSPADQLTEADLILPTLAGRSPDRLERLFL
jgi:beta-phosphoglucomutase-like phosphatase (HAD superfamily)